MYGINNYLITTTKNPYIRTIITRLRIDANKLEDCKFRNVHFKSASDNKCPQCPLINTCNDVEHFIYCCEKQEEKQEENIF